MILPLYCTKCLRSLAWSGAPPKAPSAPPLQLEASPSMAAAAVTSPSPSQSALSTEATPSHSPSPAPSEGQPSMSPSPSVANPTEDLWITKAIPQPPPLDVVEGGSSGLAIAAATPSASEEPPSIIRCKASAKKLKMQHLMKATGKKFKIEYSIFHKGSGTKLLHDTFTRDLVNAVRTNIPVLAPTFKELSDDRKRTLIDCLEMCYEIAQSPEMNEYIEEKGQKAYSAWKYECHKHYNEFGGEAIPDEFVMRLEQWQYLVKEFENEERKALCARNKSNSTKNLNHVNHHSGLKPS